MKHRDLQRLLAKAGFQYREGHGRHRVWTRGNQRIVLGADPHKEAGPSATRAVLDLLERSRRDAT